MSAEQSTTGQLRPDGSRPLHHPLDQFSVQESDAARQIILDVRGPKVAIVFRSIALEEPPKKELLPFLDLEHAGRLTANTPRPARMARIQYDIVRADRTREYVESLVDVGAGKEVHHRVVDKMHQAALTT